MTDLKISAADARHILVAIDKLPPSFYSTEAYGAAIRLHQQLIRHDIEHAKTMKALLANADKLVGVCDLQQAMCRQITTGRLEDDEGRPQGADRAFGRHQRASARLHIEAFPDDAEHPEVKVRPVTDYRSELEKSDAP